jgi:hypothetical protein
VYLPPQPAAEPSSSFTHTDAQNCVYDLRVAEMGPVCVCGMVCVLAGVKEAGLSGCPGTVHWAWASLTCMEEEEEEES